MGDLVWGVTEEFSTWAGVCRLGSCLGFGFTEGGCLKAMDKVRPIEAERPVSGQQSAHVFDQALLFQRVPDTPPPPSRSTARTCLFGSHLLEHHRS